MTSRVAESTEMRPDTAFLAKSRVVCLWQVDARMAISYSVKGLQLIVLLVSLGVGDGGERKVNKREDAVMRKEKTEVAP